MVVIIGSDNLLKVENRIAQIIELLQRLCFVKVCPTQGGRRLISTLCNVSEFVEVFECLLWHFHLEEKETSFHQSLTNRFLINLDSFWKWHKSLIVVTDSFQAIALAQISKTIVLLQLDHSAEVTQSFLPLLLEYVDLPTSNIGFDVPWITHQGFWKGTKRSLIIIYASISNR